MSTHKSFDKICVIVMSLALVITILFMNGEALGIEKIVDADAERNSDSEYFTDSDIDGNWTGYQVRTITLRGDGAKISGTGAYMEYGDLYITQSGYYEISGELTDGQIIIDAKKYSKVWIRLNGVSVYCSDSACLLVEQADKVFLTIGEGTENRFESGGTFSEEAVSAGVNGVIYARDDLTINGSGALFVSGGVKHGIKANDDLVITGGTITVDAVSDAVHVNDSLRVMEASLTLTADDDGIDLDGSDEETSPEDAALSTEKADQNTGYFYMLSGSVAITSGDDAVHCAGDITIDGGELTIAAADDGIHSEKSIVINDGTILISECYEGIEALTIDMNGGDVTIYPTDDGLNANGGNGGMGVAGGKGGMRGMNGMGGPAQDGTASGAEGEESGMPEFPEGGMPEMPEFAEGEMPEMPESADSGDTAAEGASGGEACVRITGGTLIIINETGQDADGIDSNGSIYIEGGTILISLVGNGSNNALDYGSENQGVCTVTGGTLIACGGSSMLEEFDENSTQPAVIYLTGNTAEAGTRFAVINGSGEEILTWEPACSYSAVAFSCAGLKTGETYTVCVGEDEEEISIDSNATTVGTAQGMGGQRPGN